MPTPVPITTPAGLEAPFDLSTYFPLLIYLVVCIGFSTVTLFGSWLIGPFKKTAVKQMPYESGMDPIGPAQRRFPIKFNLVAMIFILFDIEVIFFFPYALVYRRLGTAGLVEMGVFMLILLIGLFYIWKRGALEWD